MGWNIEKRGGPSSSDARVPPRDAGNLAYLIYFTLGVGYLLPYNTFITAVDYFDYLYPHEHIDRVFTVAYLVPCLITLILLVFYGQNFSSKARINTGLALYLVCVVLIPVMDAIFIDLDKGGGSKGTLYVTEITLVVTGIADAIVQWSLFTSAGELPGLFMQALVSGSAVSGVLASFLRIGTKGALPQTPRGLRLSGVVYFAVTTVTLAVCLVSFNCLDRLPIISYYKRQKIGILNLDPEDSARVPINAGEEGEEESVGEVKPRSSSSSSSSSIQTLLSPNHEGKGTVDLTEFKTVFSAIKMLAVSLLLNFLVTLCIFPGFLAEDVHSDALGDWYIVLLITLFNLFDLLGRQFPLFYSIDSQLTVLGSSLWRLLFIPLFGICLVGPSVLRTEVPICILTALLGLTNGIVDVYAFILAPQAVSLDRVETSSLILVIFLVSGLSLGAVVSWLWEL